MPSPGGPQSTPERRFFRSLPLKSLQCSCKFSRAKEAAQPPRASGFGVTGSQRRKSFQHPFTCGCAAASEQSHGSATPAARLPPRLRVWDSKDREVAFLLDSRWFKQAYVLHRSRRVCFKSGSSPLDSLCTFSHCLNLRIRPSPLQPQTFDHST